MKEGNFEQKPKSIDEQIDDQKKALEKEAQMLHDKELKEGDEKYEKLRRLQDEYEKLQPEYDEKWNLAITVENEEWAIQEKYCDEIDESHKTTEDPAKRNEIANEINNKYDYLLNDAHAKSSAAWQVCENIKEIMEEKWKEINQLFKKEGGQQ